MRSALIRVAIFGLFATACFGAGIPTSITFSPPTLTALVNSSNVITVTVKDAAGIPVPGTAVTLSVPSTTTGPTGFLPGGNTITTGLAGTAQFTLMLFYFPGNFDVIGSTLTSALTVVSGTLQVTCIGPVSLVPTSTATPQVTYINTAFQPLAVLLLDQNKNPIPNFLVSFAAPPSGASGFFSNGTQFINVMTDSTGLAKASFGANGISGPYTVVAESGEAQVTIVAGFSLFNRGIPASVTPQASSSPQATPVGTQFSQPLALTVKDATNIVTPGLDVAFTAPASGPSGVFSNGMTSITAATNAGGVVSVPFTANQVTGGPYIVMATIGGLSTPFSLTNTGTAPVVTQNPTNVTVAPGATATFTAAATGNPVPTVQWQTSIDGGATFSNIAGATSTTLSFSAAASQNGNQFRAIFKNAVNSATTSAATLTVQSTLTITQNPVDAAVAVGATASFTAAATATPSPTIQWQQSTNGGATFTNIAGATSTTFSFVAAASQNGNQFRAVFTSGTNTATTSAATLTVQTALTITQNPVNVTAAVGATASFTAAATATPSPTAQWQQSIDGGATFANIAGATSTTLSFTAAASQNGNQFRAVFTSGSNTATTSAATLTVQTGPMIRTSNPVVPAFLGNAGFSSNMYVEIYGANFTTITRLWNSADFSGAIAPTSLEGVSVKVNNKPAFVYFISPSQININVPEDSTTGPVTVQVFTSQGASNIVTVQRSDISPTLQSAPQFNVGGVQYVVALTPDFSNYIGRPNLVAGLNFVTPRPGDIVSIFALGAGPTNPPTQAGLTAAQNSPITLLYQVKIGGVPATVNFAGVLANTIGLYQLNVVIPNVPAGDQLIEFIVNGVPNNQNLFITTAP